MPYPTQGGKLHHRALVTLRAVGHVVVPAELETALEVHLTWTRTPYRVTDRRLGTVTFYLEG